MKNISGTREAQHALGWCISVVNNPRRKKRGITSLTALFLCGMMPCFYLKAGFLAVVRFMKIGSPVSFNSDSKMNYKFDVAAVAS